PGPPAAPPPPTTSPRSADPTTDSKTKPAGTSTTTPKATWSGPPPPAPPSAPTHHPSNCETQQPGPVGFTRQSCSTSTVVAPSTTMCSSFAGTGTVPAIGTQPPADPNRYSA